ncbi:MAG: GNAT family N-acetyltransferase [Candidatus Heimdallarchaeota archaeon]|nr:MAG: GNAT family N-acetyltransferase [Candidatus Heimdallarchaeota archaeon]
MNISIIKDKDNFEGIIRPINTGVDSQKLADFFNAIDDLWPGTWTQGIKYDEKRAKEFIEKRKALEWFVAFDPQDRLVGFCSVHKRMEEPNVSYIGVLGAHPEVLGKKYGKHLLLTAVDFSVKNGDVRQDLHTWPSNMKAVPLYKKIGLQWVPDTSVYMQNYIPIILQNSFCKPFFDKHPDWYLDQKRDVTQAPDEQTLGSMKVFYYRFEKGEDFLEVIIDRYSRSIVGITRKIDGELIGITLQQKDHDVFAGIKHKASLLIKNESSKELSVIVSMEGSKEITVKASQEILTVPKGRKTLENTYVVDDITSDTDIQRKTPSIRSRIIIDGEVLTLEAGMKVRQLIDIMISDQVWWRPSGKQAISIHVQNRSEKPIEGELVFWSINEIEILSPVIPIKLAPEENIGVDAQIEIPTNDEDIFTTLYCQVKMGDVKSRVFELPIFLSNNQGLAAGIQQDKKCVIIQNQYIRGVLKLEGASVDFRTPDETLMGVGLRTLDYGPPFGFSEFNQVEFSPKIIEKRNSIQVKLSRRGQSKGDLFFHRIFELKAGDPHFATWTEVQNLGTVDDQITTILEPHFTHGINMPLGETYFVFDDQLVCGPAFFWPAGKGDLPEGTERYEPWVCMQLGDVSYYHIYETHDTKADPSRSKLSSLEKQIQIPALSSCSGPKSWIGCGNIEWKRVRELAYYLSKNQVLSPIQQNIEPKSYLNLEIPKNQLLIGKKISEIQITLKSIRLMPLNGRLIIEVPKGWTITPNEFEIANLNLNNSQEFKCKLELPNNVIFGTFNLNFIIESPEKRETRHIQFLVFDGKEKPEILDLPPESNKNLILARNNNLEITSSGDFAACLTQIKYNGQPYLLSNFPNYSPSIFFSKDPGGMVNSIFQSEQDDLDDPSYLKEKYVSKKIQSDHWSGVEYSTTLHEIKSLKGLAIKIAYEILGGDSSLIRVRTTIHNPTSATFRAISVSLLSPGIDGSIENMVSRFSIGTEAPFQVSRDNPVPIFGAGPDEMAYLTLAKENNSLSVIKTSSRTKLIPLDAGKMILGAGFLTFWSLRPNQTDEVSYFISLNSKEEFLKDISHIF